MSILTSNSVVSAMQSTYPQYEMRYRNIILGTRRRSLGRINIFKALSNDRQRDIDVASRIGKSSKIC